MASLLVVDDDPDGLEALCAFLKKFGHDVKCVANGRPLVERARHLKVNAILVKGKATYDDILLAVQTELHRVPT